MLPSLSSALLRKVIRYRFTILLRQLFFIIISLPYIILILFSVQLPNFLKLVRSWSVLFRRWLLIPCQFPFNPTGKKRLILDLRHANFFVKKSKIKFEDAKSFLECLIARHYAWACSFDIKSGYQGT